MAKMSEFVKNLQDKVPHFMQSLHGRAQDKVDKRASAQWWAELRSDSGLVGIKTVFTSLQRPLTRSLADSAFSSLLALSETVKPDVEEMVADKAAVTAQSVAITNVLRELEHTDALLDYWKFVHYHRQTCYALQVLPRTLYNDGLPTSIPSAWVLFQRLCTQPNTSLKHTTEHRERLLELLGRLQAWRAPPGRQKIPREGRRIAKLTHILKEDKTVDEAEEDPQTPLAERIKACQKVVDAAVPPIPEKCKAPGFLLRWWPAVTAGAIIIPIFLRMWFKHDAYSTLVDLIANARETFTNFVVLKIIDPVKEIYESIRYHKDEYTMQSPESFQGEIDSLCRMVHSYVVDRHPHLEPAEIAERARIGDIDLILKTWEYQLANPTISFMTDSMFRTFMIQIQKSKVDLGMAVNAMDKVMQSQELNFQVMSLMPACVILFLFLNGVYKLFRWAWDLPGIASNQRLQMGVLDLAELLNSELGTGDRTDSMILEGNVVFQTHKLISQAYTSRGIKRHDRDDFVADLIAVMTFSETMRTDLKEDVALLVWHQRLKALDILYKRYF